MGGITLLDQLGLYFHPSVNLLLLKMSPTSTTVSIVMLGQFHPDNFLPKKLAEEKVIPKKLADTAIPKLLVPSETIEYQFDWALVAASRTRLQVQSDQAPYVRICDLLVKAVGDLSPKSTVTAFGVNVE